MLLQTLRQLSVQLFRHVLLFTRIVSDTGDFRFDLEDAIVALINQLLDRLQGLVSLLHGVERLLPIFEHGLLRQHNAFNFDRSLFEGVASRRSFLFLRDELGLVQRLLLV